MNKYNKNKVNLRSASMRKLNRDNQIDISKAVTVSLKVEKEIK
jgi:hypothetical protein